MTRIFKYAVPFIGDEVEVMMPEGARVLSVALQLSRPQIWAAVDDEAKAAPRRFRWVETGAPAGDLARAAFVGTVLLSGGSRVFHLFEVA